MELKSRSHGLNPSRRMGGCRVAVGGCAVVAALLAGLAISSPAATATASARPTRICSSRQTLEGECGQLPLRSCLNLFPTGTFENVTASLLEYVKPGWVAVAAPSNTHTCGVQLSLMPPPAESPALVPLALCEGAEAEGATPPGSCKIFLSSQISFSRYPSHAQALRTLFTGFCETESFGILPGDTIGKIQGLKACLNSSEGYAGVAADNIMVRLTDFHPPDAKTTPTAAMQKVLAYLVH